ERFVIRPSDGRIVEETLAARRSEPRLSSHYWKIDRLNGGVTRIDEAGQEVAPRFGPEPEPARGPEPDVQDRYPLGSAESGFASRHWDVALPGTGHFLRLDAESGELLAVIGRDGGRATDRYLLTQVGDPVV